MTLGRRDSRGGNCLVVSAIRLRSFAPRTFPRRPLVAWCAGVMRSKSLMGSPVRGSGLVHGIVGDELCTVDVTCRIRDGKDNEVGDLLGRAPARITHALITRPKRSLARGVLRTELALGNFTFPFGKALRRIDEARYHAVDADVVWRKLVG